MRRLKGIALRERVDMNVAQTTGAVKEVIISLFNLGIGPDEIADQTAIFDAGIGLDSMAAVALLEGLEERFAVCLGSEDLTMENFQTISAVAALICRKKGGAA